MDIESVVLVISVILLFVIGYVAVGVLIPDPRKIRKRRNRRRKKKTHRTENEPCGVCILIIIKYQILLFIQARISA